MAAVTGLVGIHLSFGTYMMLTSALAGITNPLVFIPMLAGGTTWMASRANRSIRNVLYPTFRPASVMSFASSDEHERHLDEAFVARLGDLVREIGTGSGLHTASLVARFPALGRPAVVVRVQVMLPGDVLAGLDRLPIKEGLRRPLDPNRSKERRVASLLAGDNQESRALDRWRRGFSLGAGRARRVSEAEVCNLHQMSELVGAAGRIPSRFSLLAEARRSETPLGLMSINDVEMDASRPLLATARSYVLQRLVVHLYDAQGCEAVICGSEADPTAIVLNGLQAIVHDPKEG